MKFFLDTADIKEIKDLNETGMVDGITTNPSLILKSGRNFKEVVKEICDVVQGDVSAEVTVLESDKMIAQGRELSKIAKNIVVKVPLTWDGLKACRILSNEGIGINVTLCFSASQAILAAKAGARYVSPFVGRHDDISQNGMGLIQEIAAIYRNYPYFKTQILVASVRHPLHIISASLMGAHVCTIPPSVMRQLANHPLTDKGLETFMKDWQKTGQVF